MLWTFGAVAELPLADDGRGIAGLFEDVSERRLLGIEQPEANIVPDIVLPGHELDSGRRAERLHIAVIEANPGRSEPIQVRRPVRLASVGAHAFIAEVIGHDEDDVRLFRGVHWACQAQPAITAQCQRNQSSSHHRLPSQSSILTNMAPHRGGDPSSETSTFHNGERQSAATEQVLGATLDLGHRNRRTIEQTPRRMLGDSRRVPEYHGMQSRGIARFNGIPAYLRATPGK